MLLDSAQITDFFGDRETNRLIPTADGAHDINAPARLQILQNISFMCWECFSLFVVICKAILLQEIIQTFVIMHSGFTAISFLVIVNSSVSPLSPELVCKTVFVPVLKDYYYS